MSFSTDGHICFGIRFEEGHEFPWDDERYNCDIEEWWRSVRGFKPTKELFTENGEFIGGVEPPDSETNAYFDEMRAWHNAHPLPIELVNYCSGECEMFILAVPSSCKTAARGEPEMFEPCELTVTPEEIKALLDFCAEFGIKPDEDDEENDGQPHWFLCGSCD